MADPRSFLAALRRYPDPAASTDPLISALVRRLSTLPSPAAPDPGFRAELRAQLVAVAPRLVAEGVPTDAVSTEVIRPRRPAGSVRATWRHVPFRRPLAVLGTLVVIFGLLLTGAVWLSSGTLPGDSLYGLKRAGENVQLSLTSGDGARGKEYLTLARRRIDEVSKLLSRSSALAANGGISASGGINAHTARLVTSTLGDADSDMRDASRLLTGQAVHDSSADSLHTLLGWLPQQMSRLTTITGRIPPSALHNRAMASEQLAARVRDRASQLLGSLGCACRTGTSTDDLGPLPCHLPCAPPPGRSTAPTVPGTAVTSPGSASAPTSRARTTGSTGGAPVSPPPVAPSTGSGSASGGGTSSTPLPLPSLPTGTGLPTGALPTSGSVVLDPCGGSVTVGPIGIGLGLCGSHPHR